jgi:hypothetical protein
MLAAVKYDLGRASSFSATSLRKGFARTGVSRHFLLLSFFLGLLSSAAAAASSPPQMVPGSPPISISNFALADFDGDRIPDLASVEFSRFDSSAVRYSITFRLTTGGGQTVGIIAPFGGLDIAARDVNGDAALDLIVRTAWQHQVVAIFLNDGHGHFAAADPSDFSMTTGESSTAWLPATSESHDNSALSLPGNSAWQYEGGAGLSHPQELWHCAYSSVFKISNLFFASSLGRAPPTLSSLP